MPRRVIWSRAISGVMPGTWTRRLMQSAPEASSADSRSSATHTLVSKPTTVVPVRCAIDAAWSNYGDGFPGTFGVPALTSSSLPVLGTSVTVDLANSCGQWTFALLFEGFERASIHSSLGGDLLLVPSMITVVGLPPWGATYSADLPTNGVFCGVTIDVQAIESDPGAVKGASFTEGLELLLGH